MDQNEFKKAVATKSDLDSISPSFCTVRWKHATLNLGAGATKSCCHLPFQKMNLENLKPDEQLHETQHDKVERAQMLKGEKPKDCSYCWWTEDQGHLSDRIVWSSKSWMAPYAAQIKQDRNTEAQSPSWLELNFSNVCNLKCSYCSPIFSSKWQQEIKEFGPYPTFPAHNDLRYLSGVELTENYDNTLLMEKFWPWFEKIYPDLRLLKITGGEPFLSPHTFKILDWVLKNPNPKLTLSINSNLTVPENNWDRFISLVSEIQKKSAIEKFYLHPSIDSFGKRAEYIRFGLDFAVFQKHVEDYLERSQGNLVFICTLNNLALGGLLDLWKYILSLKQRFGPRGQWVSMTSEVLYGPEWQNINILPTIFQNYFHETLAFAQRNFGNDLTHFSSFEIMGLERGLQMMKQVPSEAKSAKKNFYKFFTAHDIRRKTDISSTFPEMENFWAECKGL